MRGQIVVIGFWATWCGPCLPGLGKVAAFEKKFAGQPIRFFTVANDESSRVRTYLAEKGIFLQAFVDDQNRTTCQAWGVLAIPATAIVNRQGNLVAVTLGENITEAALQKLLNGESVDLPAQDRPNNIFWNRDEIQWLDGVGPLFQVVIKPIKVSGGGYSYKPGSDRISGDGAPVQAMIEAAWQVDKIHLDIRTKLAGGTYRFAAVVPPGREAELLPSLQNALQRTFGFSARLEDSERDVLILTHNPSVVIKTSPVSSQPKKRSTRRGSRVAAKAGASDA